MNKKMKTLIIILIIVIVIIAVGWCWLYLRKVTITTDRIEYEQGETINIIMSNESFIEIWCWKDIDFFDFPYLPCNLQKKEAGRWVVQQVYPQDYERYDYYTEDDSKYSYRMNIQKLFPLDVLLGKWDQKIIKEKFTSAPPPKYKWFEWQADFAEKGVYRIHCSYWPVRPIGWLGTGIIAPEGRTIFSNEFTIK